MRLRQPVLADCILFAPDKAGNLAVLDRSQDLLLNNNTYYLLVCILWFKCTFTYTCILIKPDSPQDEKNFFKSGLCFLSSLYVPLCFFFFIKINTLLRNYSVDCFLTFTLLPFLHIHLCNSFIQALVKHTDVSFFYHFWVPSTSPEI